jgi:hypothetical protein
MGQEVGLGRLDPPFSVTPCPPVPDTGVPEGVRDGVREGEEEGEGMGVGDLDGEGAARGTRTLVPAGCVSRAAVAPDPGALVTTLRDTRDASRASGVPCMRHGQGGRKGVGKGRGGEEGC